MILQPVPWNRRQINIRYTRKERHDSSQGRFLLFGNVRTDNCARQIVFPWKAKVQPCAAGGLFSTPQDMVRFSQMLAHHGEWKGRQIISRKTFDSIFSVKQTPAGVSQPYCVGSWLYGDWFGHEGAMRTDQRANLKTGHCRVFFIQTENRAGSAFFELKKAWNAACDEVQRSGPFNPGN